MLAPVKNGMVPLYKECLDFQFSKIIVEEVGKWRSYVEPDDVKSTSAMDGT